MAKTNQTNLTTNDLMKFLEDFQKNMENKIADTKSSIDSTNTIIEKRLDNIDEEIMKTNNKMDENEELTRRMDRRLTDLENEMRRSTALSKRSNKLKDIEKLLENGKDDENAQSESKSAHNTRTEAIKKEKKKYKVEQIANAIVLEPVGTFRSS